MTQTATQPTTQPRPANGALVKKEERAVEFVPFLESDAIKLSVSIVKSLVCAKTKKGHVCDDASAMKFIMLCKARKLNPFVGDAFLVGYDTQDGPVFNLITAHQALLKRAEVHVEFDGMRSGVLVVDGEGNLVDREGDFFLEDDRVVGGWATVYFKTRKYPMHKRIRLATFNTGYSRWKTDPAGMIVKCAEADALRSAFPSVLGGMYLEDELSGEQVRAPRLAPPDRGHQNLRIPKQVPIEEQYQSDVLPAEDQRQPDAPEEPPSTLHPADSGLQTPDATPSEDEMAKDDLAQQLVERVTQATTESEIADVGSDLADRAEWLGQFRETKVADAINRQRGVLKPVEKAKARR
jgi:phage recombination protein Bet